MNYGEKKVTPFYITQTFPNDISWFATCMNLSKGVVASLDGINDRSIQTLLREY